MIIVKSEDVSDKSKAQILDSGIIIVAVFGDTSVKGWFLWLRLSAVYPCAWWIAKRNRCRIWLRTKFEHRITCRQVSEISQDMACVHITFRNISKRYDVTICQIVGEDWYFCHSTPHSHAQIENTSLSDSFCLETPISRVVCFKENHASERDLTSHWWLRRREKCHHRNDRLLSSAWIKRIEQ